MASTTHSIDSLVEKVESYAHSGKGALLHKAYEYSKKSHANQKRLSGEPYITHPLAVAHILAEMKADPVSIAASLMHDVIEDTPASASEIKKEFGKDIMYLVEGVSKLSKIHFGTRLEHQVENFRRMFMAMAKDIRVIIIKLADRLHNMRTLEFLPPEKQKRISQETLDVYAPLAHRLGMGHLKWELEDLSFRYLKPEQFQSIKNLIAEKRRRRESNVKKFIDLMTRTLAKENVEASIEGRPKHFYSIYHKMQRQNINFEDVYDLMAIRIIVKTIHDCYTVMGITHSLFKPLQGKFKDYIAMPKSNGYQSLHTTVIGTEGKPVEIQIRTEEMHRIAEQGIAAHWKYKQGDPKDSRLEERLAWLRQLIEWQKEKTSAQDFMHKLKVDLFEDEVFVFTPKGDVIDLPNGATVLDFAYKIHTEIGHRTQGAKIHGQIVPLDTPIKNGDIVEILLIKKSQPHMDWLSTVKTHQAKSKIKAWFRKQRSAEKIKLGKESFERSLKSLLLDPTQYLTPEIFQKLFPRYKIESLEDVYRGISSGEWSAKSLAEKIKEHEDQKLKTPEEQETSQLQTSHKSRAKHSIGVEVIDAPGVLMHLAKCRTPLPGDDIIGVISKGHGVSVHRKDCPNSRGPNKAQTEVRWIGNSEAFWYSVNVEVLGFDRVGLLKDILNSISETDTNISEANVRRRGSGGEMLAHLILEVKDNSQLAHVIQRIRQIPDIYDVYRK